MATKSISFRLEPDLVPLVEQHAKTAGQDRSAYLAAIVESHLRGNGNGRPAPSDDLLRRHDQILQVLRTISAESTTLTQAVAQKEREASADFAELGKQLDRLRSDIATLFAAALQSFAGVERNEAISFTQKYMYPANGRG